MKILTKGLFAKKDKPASPDMGANCCKQDKYVDQLKPVDGPMASKARIPVCVVGQPDASHARIVTQRGLLPN